MAYQQNYSLKRPQMFDKKGRLVKSKQILKVLEDHYQGLAKIKGLKVLDIGCSTGIIDNFLADYFQTLTGIDIDVSAINFAKANFRKPNLKFQIDDILNTKHKTKTYDLIICHHIYEHMPNSQKLFDQIYNLLKAGGICYLAAVNKFWILEPHYNLPFLSFFPKPLANSYLQIFQGKDYYENPKSYWQLKKELKEFELIDYTPKILSNPKKYGYQTLPVPLLSNLLKYLCPTFIWILKK